MNQHTTEAQRAYTRYEKADASTDRLFDQIWDATSQARRDELEPRYMDAKRRRDRTFNAWIRAVRRSWQRSPLVGPLPF